MKYFYYFGGLIGGIVFGLVLSHEIMLKNLPKLCKTEETAAVQGCEIAIDTCMDDYRTEYIESYNAKDDLIRCRNNLNMLLDRPGPQSEDPENP